MKKQLLISCATLVAITSISYGASISSLSKDQVKKAFSDKTVTTISSNRLNDQVNNVALTAYMDNNGNISGQFMNNNMNSQATMPQPQADQGTYKIKNNGLLCITWQNWNNGKEFCVYTYETSNAYVFIDDHHVFHTVTMKADVKSGNQMGNMGQMNPNSNTTTTPVTPDNTNTSYPATPTTNTNQ